MRALYNTQWRWFFGAGSVNTVIGVGKKGMCSIVRVQPIRSLGAKGPHPLHQNWSLFVEPTSTTYFEYMFSRPEIDI